MGVLTSAENAVATGRHRSYGLLVLALALVLRSTWALFVPVGPISDCIAYDAAAINMANGQGYCFVPGNPTALWPVGISFLLSLFYRAFGHVYGPIVVFNVGLGVAIVGLTMVLAQRMFGPHPALIAGILTSIWPLLIEYTTILASELPFLVAMLLGWVFWSAPGLRVPTRSVLAGVAIAAACYLRPTALLLPGVLAISEVLVHRRLLGTTVQVVLVAIVMLMCIIPWSMRNYRLFGEFDMISTNGGGVTWMGNSPGSSGFYRNLPSMPELNEAQRDRYFAREASAYIRQYPRRFALRSLVKFVRVHERESIGIVWNCKGLEPFGTRGIFVLKLASNLYWWVVLALAVCGIVLLVRSLGLVSALFYPALLVWGYFAVVHAVTVVGDRYHMPAIPSIACLAALALGRWPKTGCGRRIAGENRG